MWPIPQMSSKRLARVARTGTNTFSCLQVAFHSRLNQPTYTVYHGPSKGQGHRKEQDTVSVPDRFTDQFVKCCEEDAGAETGQGIRVKGGHLREDTERTFEVDQGRWLADKAGLSLYR